MLPQHFCSFKEPIYRIICFIGECSPKSDGELLEWQGKERSLHLLTTYSQRGPGQGGFEFMKRPWLSHSVYGILLQQHERTKTPPIVLISESFPCSVQPHDTLDRPLSELAASLCCLSSCPSFLESKTSLALPIECPEVLKCVQHSSSEVPSGTESSHP